MIIESKIFIKNGYSYSYDTTQIKSHTFPINMYFDIVWTSNMQRQQYFTCFNFPFAIIQYFSCNIKHVHLHLTLPKVPISETERYLCSIWVLFDKIFRKTTFQKSFEKGRVQRKYTFMRTFCESNKNFGLNLPHEQLQMRKL